MRYRGTNKMQHTPSNANTNHTTTVQEARSSTSNNTTTSTTSTVTLYHRNCFLLHFSRLWCRIADKLPYVIGKHFFPSLEESKWVALLQLAEVHVEPYQKETEAHVQQLGVLWTAHHRITSQADRLPFDPSQHAVHAEWKVMGFQAEDPSTDFRGGGMLSLTQLCYLAEHYPSQWTKMVSGDFLLAAAGINVSMRLITLLGLNEKKNVLSVQLLPTYSRAGARVKLATFMTDRLNQEEGGAKAMECLHEVYCSYMHLLFKEWEASDRNLLAFNSVLNDTYKKAEVQLCIAYSLDEFQTLINEED